MRQQAAVRRGDGRGAARLRAREGPADEELVGLADLEALAHAPTGASARYSARPWRPPSRPKPDSRDPAERARRVELVEAVGPHDARRAGVARSRGCASPSRSRCRPTGRSGSRWPSRRPRPRCGRSAPRAPARRPPRGRSPPIRRGRSRSSAGRRGPPTGSRARAGRCGSPRPRRPPTNPRMRSSWADELMAPTSVFLSSGSPTRRSSMRRRRRSSSSSATPSCTSRRDPAQHTWPWLKKMPSTIPSTTWSRAASSNTMFAPLPPSSSVRRVPVPASARRIALPTPVEPVNATLSSPGCAARAAPVVPAPGHHVDHARRQVGLGDQLGEQERRERRGLGGLQHHRVAAREGGRDLPGRHQEGEVPGDDLPHHPERARRHPRHRVLELVGPAGVVEEVGRGQRHVDVARLADRLAAVDRLQHRELARAVLQQAGQAEQVLRPRHGRTGRASRPRRRGARRRPRRRRRRRRPRRHRPGARRSPARWWRRCGPRARRARRRRSPVRSAGAP